MNETDRKALSRQKALCGEPEENMEMEYKRIGSLSPAEVRKELEEMGIDPEDLYRRIRELLGQPIPEKAILVLDDFRYNKESSEFVWMLDHHLRIRFIRDGESAYLMQSMRGKSYDAPLYWEEPNGDFLAFPNGACSLSVEDIARLEVVMSYA